MSEEECENCGEAGCEGLNNCSCGEDMRCTESLCRRCEGQKADDECEEGDYTY